MNKWIIYFAITLLSALGAYHLTISTLPNWIYNRVQGKMMKTANMEINTLRISPLPDANSRSVVKPNPDFMYLTAYYDLSEGPLKLNGVMPDSTYWSVAMYHPNTVNWYVRNDSQFETSTLDLNINYSKKMISDDLNTNAISTQSKGFLLIRILMTDRSLEKVTAYRKLLSNVKLTAI